MTATATPNAAAEPVTPATVVQPAPVPAPSAAMQPYDPKKAEFELANRRAKVLSLSTLVPPEYRGPDGMANCMIALNMADRINADPLAVIQNLDIIHGRPGLRSSFLIATVNACKRFTPLRWEFEGKEGTDAWGCRAVATDKETGEKCVGTLITIGIAKAEGWYSRSGSKWKTIPEQMLRYRSAAFWTRLYAPELSLGIQTAEEVSDVTGTPMADMPASLTPAASRMLEEQLLQTRPKEPEATPQPPSPPASEPKAGSAEAPKPAEDQKLVDPTAATEPAPKVEDKPKAEAKAKASPKAKDAPPQGLARDGSDGSVPADQEPPEREPGEEG